ncbi:MAG: hypothetical protein COA85_06320 [Robiginitomaculum sp.]|nr:MAG: hypothetical protein COA85_06320 [Robiginitomaculum sp.]
MHHWFLISLVCIFGIMVLTVRANAAPASLHIDDRAILSVNYTPTKGDDKVIGLRLRRGIFRHGHLRNHRTLRFTAYDENGTIIANKDKRIGKRQTYVHLDFPPAFSQASDIIVSLQ